jgi:hypothetical protein
VRVQSTPCLSKEKGRNQVIACLPSHTGYKETSSVLNRRWDEQGVGSLMRWKMCTTESKNNKGQRHKIQASRATVIFAAVGEGDERKGP